MPISTPRGYPRIGGVIGYGPVRGSGVWTLQERYALEDDFYDDVSLLLKMNGANGSTTFLDSSQYGHAVTANGDAQISTTQSKFGGSSGAFDGTGDYLSVASASNFNFSSVAFTVECWIRPANITDTNTGIFGQRISGVYTTFDIQQSQSKLRWLIGNSSLTNWDAVATTATGLISANTWHHVALVGDGSNLALYIDGTSRLTTSQPAWTSAARPMYIGATGDGAFNGYIDSLRITKGQARYTAAFTTPQRDFLP